MIQTVAIVSTPEAPKWFPTRYFCCWTRFTLTPAFQRLQRMSLVPKNEGADEKQGENMPIRIKIKTQEFAADAA